MDSAFDETIFDYKQSIFRDVENVFRTKRVEEDIKFISQRCKSNFITYEILPCK